MKKKNNYHREKSSTIVKDLNRQGSTYTIGILRANPLAEDIMYLLGS